MPININKKNYNSLSSSERKVIDYIDKNISVISSTSITKIANKTYTSTATVSRAIYKLGYKGGISQLRYECLQNGDYKHNNIKESNVNKVLSKFYLECAETIDNIAVTDVIKVSEAIKTAKRIFIIALGTSAMIAKIFQEQLIILGYTPVLIDDTVWLKNANLNNNTDDLVIVLTLKCSEEQLLYYSTLRMKNNGAKIVVCTCKKGTKLTCIADMILYGHSEDEVTTGYIVNTSRIPLMLITRIIVEYLEK